MRGRKPDLNKAQVVQLPGSTARPDDWHLEQAAAIRPRGFNYAERQVWDRVAPELSRLGRLKPIYADVIAEYCRVVCRLAEFRKTLDEEGWTYATKTRNGDQHKSHPRVAQLNDDWRKWRSLVSELGLSPVAERGLNSMQGDFFDDFEAL